VSIGKGAFQGCSNMQSITIPFVGATLNGTTNSHFAYIFGGASYQYPSYVPTTLKTVIITGGSKISYQAFSYCSNITSITLPNTLTQIEQLAFDHCYGLTEIVIPASVNEINKNAFDSCSNLTSVIFADPTNWGYITAGYASFENEDISNSTTAAQYLTNTYRKYTWKRKDN
jgi:hypothetical protein